MVKKVKKEKAKKKVYEDRKASISRVGKNKYDVAMQFAGEIFERFPEVVKTVALFGSVKKINHRLHVNTVPLTVFWDNVKAGEPIAINVLRYGVPMIDTGYFEPMQFLLKKGRIKPTYEAISNCMTRAPWHITRANGKMLNAVVDLHWTMVDSAQAALMEAGHVPPSKENISNALTKTFVKKGKLSKKFVDDFITVYNIAKKIEHGSLTQISGRDYDSYKKKAENFYKKMKRFVKV
jgi:uncharacterized protein (UPF0332 family)